MAATTTRRPAAGTRAGAGARPSSPAGGRELPAAALGIALAVAVIYASFASGAIGVAQGSRLQIGVAAIAFATLAGMLYGRGLRVHAPATARWGVALLAGFAAWAALSITWSVAPDQSWLDANRALAFTLVAGLGIALGSSLPRAAERAALAYLAIVTAIALYALGGKLFPWFHIGGLIDLNHTQRFSRLRAPLDYWNALGMVCVLAVPIGMRVVAELRYGRRLRIAGAVSLVLSLTTLALTYSRGGLLVLVAAVALVIAVGPDRSRLAAALGAGVAGAVLPVVTAVVREDLTTDGLPIHERSADGLIFLAALAIGIAIAVVWALAIIRAGDRLRLDERGARRARRAALIGGLGAVAIVLGVLALSDRGIGGSISHQADEFTKPKLDRQNDPARVLRTNSGNRWVWWQEAVGGWSDRPLIGYGAGSFPTTHRMYRKNSIEVLQPHSVPLQFLTETGLIGALLALGGLALLGVAAIRNLRVRPPGTERAFAAALLAGVFAWSLHLWLDWDWDIPAVTLPVLALLGLLAARPAPDVLPAPAAVSSSGRRAAWLVAGGAAACVAIALAALPAVAESLTDSALSRAASGKAADLRAAEQKAALAKRLNPLAVEPVFAQASIAERGNQPAAAVGLLVEAVDRQPDNADAWGRLLRFQALIDDPRGALRSLNAIFSLDPLDAFRSAATTQIAFYDPARSASATGTPLPEKVKPRPKPPPKTPQASALPGRIRRKLGAPKPAAPKRPPAPAPTPSPAPPTRAPAPAPKPKPAPKKPPPQPQGDPFRLEG